MKKLLSSFIVFLMLIQLVSIGANAQGQPESIKINEVCSGNSGANGNLTNVKDSNDKYCDWIELYNSSNATVDVSNWGVSDDESKPFKCKLAGNTTIAANSYLIIYCSKSIIQSDLYQSAAIGLSGSGESLIITDSTSSYTDKVSFPELANDTTYSRIPDGSDTFKTVMPTPGETNENAENLSTVTAPFFSKIGGMYKESFTLTITADSDCTIYYTNDGSDPVTSTTRKRYSNGIVIKDVTGQQNILSNKTSNAYIGKANVIRAVAINTNNEYSSVTSATYFLGANNETYGNMPIISLVSDSKNLFSEETGIYVEGKTRSDFIENNRFKVGSQLKFTIPNVSAGNYSFDITTVNGTNRSSFKTYINGTQTSITVDTSVGSGSTKTNLGNFSVAQNSNVEIITEITEEKSSAAYIYCFDLTDENSSTTNYLASACTPLGRANSTEEFADTSAKTKTVNSIKVVSNFEKSDVSWNDPANYNQKGRDWERNCSFEFFESDGSLALSQDCGIRIQGAYSRIASQKSFRVVARTDYGKKNFNYSFFNDSFDTNGNVIDKYKSLVIRNGGNDSGDTKYTDSYYQNLMQDRRDYVSMQSNRPVMIYLDGEFWGLYYLYEDYSENYIENKYDVDSDNVLIYKNGDVSTDDEKDNAYFNDMYEFILNNDMSKADNYAKACEYMDMDSYINYITIEFALSNGDWPKNNYALWRSITTDENNKYADGKWRWLLFDTDRCGSPWGDERYNSGRWSKLYSNITDITPVTNMAVSLKKNPEFAKKFSMTFEDILNVNLDCYVANKVLDEQYHGYLVDGGRMIYQWNRFGGGEANYNKRLSYIKEFINGRKGYTAGSVGAGAVKFLTLNSNYVNGGTYKINSSIVDLQNYEYDEFRGKYGLTYPVSITATAKDGYEFVGWEGDETSTNQTISVTMNAKKTIKAIYKKIDGVYINEICSSNEGQHSNDTSVTDNGGKYCDWVELYNSTDSAVDISGWGLSDDSEELFKGTIKEKTIINAKDYLVVYCCKDISSKNCLYVPINLSKSGETVMLTSKDEQWKDALDVPSMDSDTTYCRRTDADNILKIKYPSPNKTNNNAGLVTPEANKEQKPVYTDITKSDFYSYTTIEDFENCTPEVSADNSKMIQDGKITNFLQSNNTATLTHNNITTEYVNPTTDSKKSLKFTGSAGWETYCFGLPVSKEQISQYVGVRVWVKADTTKIRYAGLSMKLQMPTYQTTVYTDSCDTTVTTNTGHWQYFLWGQAQDIVWSNRVNPQEVSSQILQINFTFAPSSGSVIYLDDFQFVTKNPNYGDVNSDNSIDMKDFLTLKKYLAGWNVSIDKESADVNKDGNLNVMDVLVVKKYLLNVITSFN